MSALDYLGDVKQPTRDIAAEVAARFDLPDYPSPYNGPVMWGYNSGGAEHGTGRAIDFMIRNSPSVGDAIAEHLWANRERYGLIHLIWRQRIRSTKVSPGVWRGMSDRGSPTNNHMDHVHALFDGRDIGRDGGAQDVEWTPKPAPKPKPSGGGGFKPLWTPTGKLNVREIQKIVGATVDGLYGSGTLEKVRDYQRDELGVTADGYWGAETEREHFRHVRRANRPRLRNLKRGSKGRRVRDLQAGLNRAFPAYSSLAVDGVFGPATEKVVREFQRRSGLAADGIVGPRTRKALAKYGIKA